MNPTPQLLTETEAARMLRISRKAVAGFVPHIRLSARRKRYRLADLLKFINCQPTRKD